MNEKFPNPFDWTSFAKQAFGKHFPFGASFPFGAADAANWQLPDTRKIEEAVSEIVKRSLPLVHASPGFVFPPPRTAAAAKAGVFQTHGSVFVRMRLPKRTNPSAIRVLASPSQVKVKGIAGRAPLTVRLPAFVRVSQGKARIKDGILEIRLPKAKEKERARRLYVEW